MIRLQGTESSDTQIGVEEASNGANTEVCTLLLFSRSAQLVDPNMIRKRVRTYYYVRSERLHVHVQLLITFLVASVRVTFWCVKHLLTTVVNPWRQLII